MKIGNETVHVTEIDWEKRNWKRILTPEEEREIAAKMLRLNGAPDYDPAIERLLAASSVKKKPTFKVRRLSLGKLQGGSGLGSGSTIQRQLLDLEKVKAEKALRLNGI
jgi:hypothetical protein